MLNYAAVSILASVMRSMYADLIDVETNYIIQTLKTGKSKQHNNCIENQMSCHREYRERSANCAIGGKYFWLIQYFERVLITFKNNLMSRCLPWCAGWVVWLLLLTFLGPYSPPSCAKGQRNGAATNHMPTIIHQDRWVLLFAPGLFSVCRWSWYL